MKDLKAMRSLVFLLLVLGLMFTGAAFAMAEGGFPAVLGLAEGPAEDGPVALDTEEPAGETGDSADLSDTGDVPEVEEPTPDSVGQEAAAESVETSFTFVFNRGSSEETSTTLGVTLTRSNNHGAFVSAWAKMKFPELELLGFNHGEMMRQVAQSDLGKPSKTPAPEAVDDAVTEGDDTADGDGSTLEGPTKTFSGKSLQAKSKAQGGKAGAKSQGKGRKK